jgi:pimeloyl-ACP methyl ester carboxylesterase
MDHAGIDKAHIVGLSMGGFATLHLGLKHPHRVRSLCVAGCGYGAQPELREQFRAEAETIAALLLDQGIESFAERYTASPTRLTFKRSNPRGFEVFRKQLASHSALGSANTQLGVQRDRPSLYSLAAQLETLRVPTLILNGDEDEPCLVPGLMLKKTIPSAALVTVPNCGHTINLEAADAFNRIVGDFLAHADSGRWPVRSRHDPAGSIMGIAPSGRE